MILWGISLCSFLTIALSMEHLEVNFYVKYLLQGIAETIGEGAAAALFVKINPRLIFSVSFALMIIGGGGLAYCDVARPDIILVYIFEVIAILGASMAYCGVFVSTPLMFSTAVAGTCTGFCNMTGLTAQIFAPFISAFTAPIPMGTFTTMSLIGLITAQFIKKMTDEVIPTS